MIVGGLLTPLENVLTEVLTWLHESAGLTWAWSIVALTVIVRMLLVPVAIRQIHSMQSLQIHAPEMKAIQQRYKADRQKQSEELMKFYKENKINPYASCLPIVFQIPIFISLFFVLKDFEKEIFAASSARVQSLEWLGLVEHHRAVEGRLGARPDRRLRREPADVDVPHVDVDAEQGAARHDHGAPDRLPPVHPQLPVRADDLLADDEPLDDRAGHRHAAARCRGRRAPPKRSSRTPPKEDRRRRPNGEQRPPAARRAGAGSRSGAAAPGEAEARRKAAAMSETDAVTVEATGETVGEAKWAALRELEQLVPGLDRESVAVPGRLGGRARAARRRLHAGARHRERRRPARPADRPTTERPRRDAAREFVERIAAGIGADVTASARERDGVVTVTCSGADRRVCSSASTARRSTRSSTSRTRSRAREGGEHEVVVDAAGYRARRTATLENARAPHGPACIGDRARGSSSSR